MKQIVSKSPAPVDLSKFDAPAKGQQPFEAEVKSDEELAKALQEEFDREANVKANKKKADNQSSSFSPKEPFSFSSGSSTFNFGSGVTIGQFSPSTIVNTKPIHFSFPASPVVNIPKVQVPFDAHHQTYNFSMGQTFELPADSSSCTIRASKGCSIKIGETCKNITIHLTAGSTIKLDDGCTDIKINISGGSTYTLGTNCRNIYVNGSKIA